jgi:hypothetical protein
MGGIFIFFVGNIYIWIDHTPSLEMQLGDVSLYIEENIWTNKGKWTVEN